MHGGVLAELCALAATELCMLALHTFANLATVKLTLCACVHVVNHVGLVHANSSHRHADCLTPSSVASQVGECARCGRHYNSIPRRQATKCSIKDVQSINASLGALSRAVCSTCVTLQQQAACASPVRPGSELACDEHGFACQIKAL